MYGLFERFHLHTTHIIMKFSYGYQLSQMRNFGDEHSIPFLSVPASAYDIGEAIYNFYSLLAHRQYREVDTYIQPHYTHYRYLTDLTRSCVPNTSHTRLNTLSIYH